MVNNFYYLKVYVSFTAELLIRYFIHLYCYFYMIVIDFKEEIGLLLNYKCRFLCPFISCFLLIYHVYRILSLCGILPRFWLFLYQSRPSFFFLQFIFSKILLKIQVVQIMKRSFRSF